MKSNKAFTTFEKSIADYHITDDVNSEIQNPNYGKTSSSFLMARRTSHVIPTMILREADSISIAKVLWRLSPTLAERVP